jgi:transposase
LGAELAKVTLVFDKGNDSAANIASLDDAGIGFVGSLTPTQHADLLAVPDEQFTAVDELAGVVAYRAQKQVLGALRTVVVTRSESFLEKQLVGLAQTCRRTQTHLSELDRLLAGKKHRMDRARLEQRVQEALAPRWMNKLYSYRIEGTDKSDLTLVWEYDDQAFEALKTRELGKRILFTDRQGWSTKQIVVSYRSQWEVEAAFHQMKDPAHGAFRPIYHWTDQKIKVHSLYSVAALLLINLAWREANRAGIQVTPRELTEALSAIREMTLVYPPAKGKGPPRVLKKLTRMDQVQQELFELFQLDAFRPSVGNTAKWRGF